MPSCVSARYRPETFFPLLFASNAIGAEGRASILRHATNTVRGPTPLGSRARHQYTTIIITCWKNAFFGRFHGLCEVGIPNVRPLELVSQVTQHLLCPRGNGPNGGADIVQPGHAVNQVIL